MQYKTIKDVGTALNKLKQDADLCQFFVSNEAHPEEVIRLMPDLRLYQQAYYHSEVSKEAFSSDDAEAVVDKVWNFITKIFQMIWKLSVAVWKKLTALSQTLGKFLGICRKKGKRISQEILLASGESRKLVDAIKKKCDDLIKQGVTSDYTLKEYVDLIVTATGAKTKPFDATNTSSVRQWLDTITVGVTTNRIKGLPYYIPESSWMYYAFNPTKSVCSTELAKIQTAINDYYFRYALFIKDYLNPEVFSYTVKAVLSGRQNVTAESVIETLTAKIIEPFYQFDKPSFEGNFSHLKRIIKGSDSIKDIYERSNDKLEGFEAAILSYLWRFGEAHPQTYVPYSRFTTTIEDMARLAVECNRALDVLETNRVQLEKRAERPRTNLINETSLYKLLKTVLPQGSNEEITNIGKVITDIARRLDKITSDCHNYFLELSSYQLRGLDFMQTNLDRFLPVID